MTIIFHFIFVPLTLGITWIIAILETMYVRTGKDVYRDMTKFWGKIFIVNFAVGVVTGMTMEFQFGMNWSEYSRMVGDIFGAPLAVEALLAFFLESTFLAIWVFGWDKISKKFHLFAAWMIAIGSNLSALWILIANSFMQNPVGFVERNGRYEMVDIFAVVFNAYTGSLIAHTMLGAFALSGFFVMGVAAYHLFKGKHIEGMRKSFTIAMIFAVVGSLGLAVSGDISGGVVADKQKSKLAAMEALWETGENVPFYLILIPGDGENKVEALPIPGMVSLLSYGDTNAEVKGLNDFPEGDTPPVGLTFWSFRIMLVLGGLFIVLALIALILTLTRQIEKARWFHVLLMLNIPLPYIAINIGWVVAEVGRQPWIVFGKLRTAESVSPAIVSGEVWLTLIGFILFYGVLGIIGIGLMFKFAKQGPVSGQAAMHGVSSGEEGK